MVKKILVLLYSIFLTGFCTLRVNGAVWFGATTAKVGYANLAVSFHDSRKIGTSEGRELVTKRRLPSFAMVPVG